MTNITGSPKRSTVDRVFYAASIFFFLQAMGTLGFVDRVLYGEWSGKAGDPFTKTVNLLSLFVCIFLFWAGTSKTKISQFNRILPLAASGLFLISVAWSVDPTVTLTQGALYFFVVLGAIGLAEGSDGDVLMDVAALICFLSAAASVAQFFISPEPGDFRGIFSQKNVLGQVMVGGVLAGLHRARTTAGRSFRYFCVIALCTIVALMSKSSTSAFTIFMLFYLDILGRLYLKGGSRRMLGISLALVSIPIAIFFVMNVDLIFDALGKDRTMTGRTLIWPYVIDRIGEKPILGWGFCAFWSPLNPLALQIAEAIRGDNWFTVVLPNAHSGILEFLLEIGFVGTALFVFILFRNFVMAAKCLNGPAGHFGLSTLLLLMCILQEGVSEEVLLAGQQLWTPLFFMMGFICEKHLWLARARAGARWARPAAGDRLMPASKGAILAQSELARMRGLRRKSATAISDT